ncbi:MAG: redoxin domain-containing protein [bacterium]|nr:redoxin domain-containing protein [bacterium]
MQSRLDEIRGQDAELLFISADSVEASRKLTVDAGLDLRLLSDPDLRVVDAYGVRHQGGFMGDDIARPATFILDREGIVRWRDLTESFRIRVRPRRIVEELRKIP